MNAFWVEFRQGALVGVLCGLFACAGWWAHGAIPNDDRVVVVRDFMSDAPDLTMDGSLRVIWNTDRFVDPCSVKGLPCDKLGGIGAASAPNNCSPSCAYQCCRTCIGKCYAVTETPRPPDRVGPVVDGLYEGICGGVTRCRTSTTNPVTSTPVEDGVVCGCIVDVSRAPIATVRYTPTGREFVPVR